MNEVTKPRVLLVDDDASLLKLLAIRIESKGYLVSTVESGIEALQTLKNQTYDAVITDLRMDEMDGMALHRQLQNRYPALPVIMMTAHGSIPDAVEATKQGIFAFITKPVDKDELFDSLAKAIEIHGVNAEESPQKSNIVTRSGAMLHLLEQVKLLGPAQVNVLISGASGTGKELLAQAIHQHSHVSEGPFVAINCGAVPGELLESELFGHKKGAFTDAKEDRLGRFEIAEGGTLFLDEIATLSLELQSKMLRVLESKEFEVLGSSQTKTADVRIISATNSELATAIEQGEFRRDLLFRLNTIELHIPPLRDRKDDIAPLAEHLLLVHGKKYQRANMALSDDALKALKNYSWPGNIRELSHCIERAVIMSDNNNIQANDLILDQPSCEQTNSNAEQALPLLPLEELEKQMIQKALLQFNGNVIAAGEFLGLSKSAIYRRIDKHQLDLKEVER